MKSLLHTEFIKVSRYGTSRVLLGLHLAIFVLVLLIFSQIDFAIPGFNMNRLYRFPAIWISTTWVASWLNLLLAILIIILTGNEFAFRTFRQNLVSGFSRDQLVLGKIVVLIVFSLYGCVLIFMSSLLFGFIGGYGTQIGGVFTFSYYPLVYFLQAMAYMSFALLIVLIFRNTALAIVLFLLYRMVIEPLMRTGVASEWNSYFPMKAITGLTPGIMDLVEGAGANIQGIDLKDAAFLLNEAPLNQNIIVVGVYTVLFLAGAFVLIRKRNF